MRIVLAGATGLIGRALVPALVADGHEVAILTRSGKEPLAGATMTVWDGLHVEEALLDGAAAVVNLSGASIGGRRWTARRKREIVQSRVASTAALVDAAARLAPERRPHVLVSASGIGFAGDAGDRIVTEETAPGDDFLASVCVEWEAAALAARGLGMRVVLMRTSLVLSRDAHALRLMALPFRLFVGGRLGGGRQWFPWLHLDDAVGLYRRALNDPSLQGPVNLVAPELVRQRDAAREIGRILHRPAVLPTPAWALRLALGEQADLLLHGQRVASSKLSEYDFAYPRLTDALADTLG